MKLADSIAYLNHDIEDAVRAGLLHESDLPDAVHDTLGSTHSQRIGSLVTDCVETSQAAATAEPGADRRIELSDAVLLATDELRAFLFDRVYLAAPVMAAAEHGQRVIEALFTHYERHPNQIEGFSLPHDPPWRRAADYVSGMTDGYALRRAADLGLAGE